MKTATNTLASLLASAIWADGEIAEVERITAEEIWKSIIGERLPEPPSVLKVKAIGFDDCME